MNHENNHGFDNIGFEEIGDQALEGVAGGGFWGGVKNRLKKGVEIIQKNGQHAPPRPRRPFGF